MPIKKRFIAGAQCPDCGERDKIVVYQPVDEPEFRECVACGFTERMGTESPPSELPTRVAPALSDDPDLQPVRFVANPVTKD